MSPRPTNHLLDCGCAEWLSRRIYGAITLILLAGILYAGLKPFHAPENGVHWIAGAEGVRLVNHGIILGARLYPPVAGARTLEMWVEPHSVEGGNTLIAFFNPAVPRFFSVSQEERDLVLRVQPADGWHYSKPSVLNVEDVFTRGRSVLWTVTSGPQGTIVYRDGAVAKIAAGFTPLAAEFSGRIVIGTSPISNNNWSGMVRGLAVYDRALTAAQVARHNETWTHAHRPAIQKSEACVALYLFDEHAGRLVHDRYDAGGDLYMPGKYVLLRPTILDPVWSAFHWSLGFWSDALVNFLGFIPPAYFLCAWLSARQTKNAVLWASLLGAAVSLFIEVTQTHLPTRDSSMSDLLTNAAGSLAGAALYPTRLAAKVESAIPALYREPHL